MKKSEHIHARLLSQVYSPDRQAFVHNVGSTDSMRIKDILWLFQDTLNQIYLS